MSARLKFVDEDESIDGWKSYPSVLPFEYDADGERRIIEEITARERLEASCSA
jgi:hypothetical protein